MEFYETMHTVTLVSGETFHTVDVAARGQLQASNRAVKIAKKETGVKSWETYTVAQASERS